eukprot:14512305-Alexandrium_andersonii.AAC.1
MAESHSLLYDRSVFPSEAHENMVYFGVLRQHTVVRSKQPYGARTSCYGQCKMQEVHHRVGRTHA